MQRKPKVDCLLICTARIQSVEKVSLHKTSSVVAGSRILRPGGKPRGESSGDVMGSSAKSLRADWRALRA